MYYLLLIISSILFASQFLFNKKFQEEYGSTFSSSMVFSLYSSTVGVILLLLRNGFHVSFSMFSFLIALIYSAVNIVFSYASIKAFLKANLSVYSVFAMLGGMLLPFAYGILFYGEPFTAAKLLCCILIAISLIITISKKSSAKGVIFYIIVFILNGTVGILSKIHQSGSLAIDSTSFLIINKIITIIVISIILLCTEKKIPVIKGKTLLYCSGFALFTTLGNLLTLIALKFLPASVQYPIITGGTMFFSTIISLVRREKLTKRNIISAIIAFVASAILIF